MQERILTIVNVLLLGVCGWCVYLLLTTHYEEPKEIAAARKLIEGETHFNPTPVSETTTLLHQYPNLAKPYMIPLVTPTPTPTPLPPTPPPPVPLEEAIRLWTITSMDDKQVGVHDGKTNQDFTLTVGGPPQAASDNRGRPIQVKLESVDLSGSNLKATFSGENQHVTKDF